MRCPHKKPLASCLYRKQSLARSLLISCRSQSVCDIVPPIKTCISMKTSAGMRPYLRVICCPSAEIRSRRVMNEAKGNREQITRKLRLQKSGCAGVEFKQQSTPRGLKPSLKFFFSVVYFSFITVTQPQLFVFIA